MVCILYIPSRCWSSDSFHRSRESRMCRFLLLLDFITYHVIFYSMEARALKEARTRAGWTQGRLAEALGVSQAYLSMLETGKRSVSNRVARTVVHLLRLPATSIPLPPADAVDRMSTDEQVEAGLVKLGYPGLAYKRKRGVTWNPAVLLLAALNLRALDSRLAEALPWLLLEFEEWDVDELVGRAKARDLQNRLGFTVALAREVAERNLSHKHRANKLRELEKVLDSSRLAKEDTFGRSETSDRMRSWVRQNRSHAARHWNLLTDLKVDHLPYASHHS
jgi:transcriptional regulator with XRE-family HTH domain